MNEYMHVLQDLILRDSIIVYIVVFVIGFIVSLNPHMLGMVPLYVGHMVDDCNGGKKWRNLIAFSLSFSVILTLLGIGVSIVGMSLHAIMTISYYVAGIIYLYMGARLLGFKLSSVIPIKVVVISTKAKKSKNKLLSNILLPLITTPCSIPFIISLLTLVMIRGSVLYGAIILFLFGLGHSLIFILFGAFSTFFISFGEKYKYNKLVFKILGIVLIILGIVFLSLNQNPDIHSGH
ncbi:cytochrome c-type biogenesis protein [Natranaerovirga pectinivora]|uniref:Cytochrome c-type biogenesis protein n=1 Tax=Natranaerovirga pectinivora TaxID=682400 RepID=A0A4R3MLT0_9FIRM|nr:cytochrome c biogenesis protein CcdA [Natranaerovirga pectinivora]TCT15656.1 cytochrome c-type biogenesis protein [Natranaerovirga pectinivora]